jgi:hypothetical protein
LLSSALVNWINFLSQLKTVPFLYQNTKMYITLTLLTLGLALIATTSPIVRPRDLASIEAAITTIETAVNALDAAEVAYTSGDPTAIQSASDAVVTATNAGTATADASADLSETDALSLVSPIQALTTDVQNAVNEIIAKQTEIEAAGYGAATLADLIAQNTSATELANAITAKTPAALQSIAATLAAGITDAIQEGITAYSS